MTFRHVWGVRQIGGVCVCVCCAGREVHTSCSPVLCTLLGVSADPTQCDVQCNVFCRMLLQTTQRSRTSVYLSSVVGGGPQFFWLAPGRRSILRLSRAFVWIMAWPQRGADGVAGASPWRLVARCLLNILSATVFDETLSVVCVLLLRLAGACIAATF